jgi:cobalt-zinc-cadmium efflux system protein
MGHHHTHDVPPGAAPTPVSGRTMAAGLALTLVFVVAEGLCGWLGHSLALLSDAGHNVADGAALAFSWYALWIADKPRRHPCCARQCRVPRIDRRVDHLGGGRPGPPS